MPLPIPDFLQPKPSFRPWPGNGRVHSKTALHTVGRLKDCVSSIFRMAFFASRALHTTRVFARGTWLSCTRIIPKMKMPCTALNEWNWLVSEKLESPLNTAESLMCTGNDDFPCSNIVWNARKGAWELGLATLGWARDLVGADNPLYQAFQDDSLLMRGYQVMLVP
jgi:hypothetical protein